jgi:tetratricopeptide (TPR) repeat protein
MNNLDRTSTASSSAPLLDKDAGAARARDAIAFSKVGKYGWARKLNPGELADKVEDAYKNNRQAEADALSRRLFSLATPADAGVCLRLGRSYFNRGHFDKARLGLDAAARAGQLETIEDVRALATSAYVKGDYDQAVNVLEDALKRNKQSVLLRADLAAVWLSVQFHQPMTTTGANKAVRYYTEALKLKPEDPVLKVNLEVARIVKKYRPSAQIFHSGEDIKYGTPTFEPAQPGQLQKVAEVIEEALEDNRFYGTKGRTREINVNALQELRAAREPYANQPAYQFNWANHAEGALRNPRG